MERTPPHGIPDDTPPDLPCPDRDDEDDLDEDHCLYVVAPAGAHWSVEEVLRRVESLDNVVRLSHPALAAFAERLRTHLAASGIHPDGEVVRLAMTAADGTAYELTQQHYAHRPDPSQQPYLVLVLHGGADVLELSTDAATEAERDVIRAAVQAAVGDGVSVLDLG